jgi:hypothetical protein
LGGRAQGAGLGDLHCDYPLGRSTGAPLTDELRSQYARGLAGPARRIRAHSTARSEFLLRTALETATGRAKWQASRANRVEQSGKAEAGYRDLAGILQRVSCVMYGEWPVVAQNAPKPKSPLVAPSDVQLAERVLESAELALQAPVASRWYQVYAR